MSHSQSKSASRQMKITVTRVRSGRYVITREDGLELDVQRDTRGWWADGVQRPTLTVLKLDLRMGYSPWPRRDDEPQSERERAWQTAMGMRGYAGSPAEREDRKERRS